MDVACEHCQAKFKIPDEKVPKNQIFAMTCPKCKKKFSVDTREQDAGGDNAAKADANQAKTMADEVAAGAYDVSERPFDFLEEGAKTALICEPDINKLGILQKAVKNLKYHIASPQNARSVLKQMRFHVFDLVVINEMFDTPNPDQNNILRYMERLNMTIRRNMYVILLTDRFRTMDNMAAFNKSVNMTVNLSDVNEMEKIIKRGVTEYGDFYKVYRECMIKAGRA